MQLVGSVCLFLALFATAFCEDANTQNEKVGLEGKLSNLISQLEENAEKKDLGEAEVELEENAEKKGLGETEADETEDFELEDVVEKGLADDDGTVSEGGEATSDDQGIEARALTASTYCRGRRYGGRKVTCANNQVCRRRCRRCYNRRYCVQYGGSPRRCLRYGLRRVCSYVPCFCTTRQRVCTELKFYFCS